MARISIAKPSDAAAKTPPCLVSVWFRRDADGSLFTHAVFRSHDLFRAGVPNAWGLCRLAEHVAEELGWKPGRLMITSQSAHLYESCWKGAEDVARHRGRTVFEDEADRAILRVRAVPRVPAKTVYRGSCQGGYASEICNVAVAHVESLYGGRGWCEKHTPWSGHIEYCSSACPGSADHKPEAEARIAVDLLSGDGATVATIDGRNAEAVERRVLRAGWVTTPSHAAWLGRQLARAEAKMKLP